jgi:hypothetical protein
VNGIDHNVAWDRAPDEPSGFSQTWTWLGQDPTQWKDDSMEFPSVASGDNGRVGIVVGDFAAEVHFWESINNGVSFAETLITTAAKDTLNLPTEPDSTATVFLPWINTDIVYVGEEPHIVWTAAQGAQLGGVGLFDYRTRILHWSPSTGIDTVVVAQYQSAIPSDTLTYVSGGLNHLAVDWPQVGICPLGEVLVIIYVAFNPDDVDKTNDIGFGDILAVYSGDNGETWSEPINISNPNGLYPGTDDRYPSISPVNYEAAISPGMDAYIVYQTDNSAGSYLQGEEDVNLDYFLFMGIDLDIPPHELSMSGPKPGIAGMENTFEVSGATHGERVNFLYGNNPGITTDPYCPGEMVNIHDPNLFGYDVANNKGNANLTVFVPSEASGRTSLFQAFEKVNCKVSNLIEYTFP